VEGFAKPVVIVWKFAKVRGTIARLWRSSMALSSL
jgi:hypothetical protein